MNLDKPILSIADLLPDDHKTFVAEALRDAIVGWFNNLSTDDKARVISNMSYYMVFNQISDEIPTFIDTLKQKVQSHIEKKENYDFLIFGTHAAYEKPKLGQVIINQVIEENRTLIREKTEQAISELSKKDIKQFMVNFQYKLK